MNKWLAISMLLLPWAVLADELTTLTDDYSDTEAQQFDTSGPSRWHGLVGGAVVSFDKFVGAEERAHAVLPLVILSYADTAYWSIGGGGVWLLSSDDRRARLALAMRVRRGWKSDDGTELAGLRDRERTVDAGVNTVWRTRAVTLGASVFSDVSGNSDGTSATVRVSVPWRVADRWRITPNAGLEWWSARLVDYYYGVSDSETNARRTAYAGQSTTNVRVGVNAGYWLGRGWQLLGGVSYTRFGDGISSSPIVNRDDMRLVYVGAWWLF